MSHKHTWEEAQAEELAFWNTPGAEFGEQLKQVTYAKYLGLKFTHDGNSPFVLNKAGLSILDVGGGPVSLLLKTSSEKSDDRVVIDPCSYPGWVRSRYDESNIYLWKVSGERFYGKDVETKYDEVWMYNVLQHTEDPQKIFDNIYKALKPDGAFRFLDWINTATNVAHPVSLTFLDLIKILNSAGFARPKLNSKDINENSAVGKIAYGVFTK